MKNRYLVLLVIVGASFQSPAFGDWPWQSKLKLKESMGWVSSGAANGFSSICKPIWKSDKGKFEKDMMICYQLDQSTGFCCVYQTSGNDRHEFILADPECKFFENAKKFINTSVQIPDEQPKGKLWYPMYCEGSCIDGWKKHFDGIGYKTIEECYVKLNDFRPGFGPNPRFSFKCAQE
jgi:hypothetical protein